MRPTTSTKLQQWDVRASRLCCLFQPSCHVLVVHQPFSRSLRRFAVGQDIILLHRKPNVQHHGSACTIMMCLGLCSHHQIFLLCCNCSQVSQIPGETHHFYKIATMGCEGISTLLCFQPSCHVLVVHQPFSCRYDVLLLAKT